MPTRKLIRPDSSEIRRDNGKSGRRKQAPPEQTHAEEFYYLKQMAAQTPLVVMLDSGEELTGWIEWYDKNTIKFHREKEPNLLLFKKNIRYLYKEAERKRGRRRDG